MDRYSQSEVTGGRYSNTRNQEEEEEQGEELREDEDGQEMETEEAAETRKRQFLLFSSAFFKCPQQKYRMSKMAANVSDVCVSYCRCESVR